MKRTLVLGIALLIGAALGVTGCSAGRSGVEEDAGPARHVVMKDQPVSDTGAVVVVTKPPPAPLNQIRPKKPTERHVWIPGRWAWEGDRYAWIRGKWVLPERDETVWIPGSWKAVKGGWTWMPGRWQDASSGSRSSLIR